MKKMKLSDAILAGYMTNGGKQCVGEQLRERDGAMCVAGAYLKGVADDPNGSAIEAGYWVFQRAFMEAWGVDLVPLNNNRDEGGGNEPFPWEHIYGMARAAGL